MLKNLSIVAGIVLMAGCAHLSVSDSQRTTSVAFDGLWHGEINGTRQQQSAGSWELQCGKVNLNVVTQVDSGVISGYLRENENITFTTNLDDGGGFYAKVAKESSYREAPSSDISMTGKEYFVFRGRLDASSDSGKGQFVLASTQMGMGGCMTPIRFVRS